MKKISDLWKPKARPVPGNAGASPQPLESAPLDMRAWLAAHIQSLDFAGPVELRLLDAFFNAIADEATRIGAGKELIRFATQYPEKLSLLCGSLYYLAAAPRSVALRLAYIAGNFVLGQGGRCLEVAESLAQDWPHPFTAIVLSRVRGECLGIAAETEALEQAVARYPDDLVARLSLIEILVAVERVDEANQAVAQIQQIVETELADEIVTGKKSQLQLEEAIRQGTYAPGGDNDIYTDEVCRSYWTSYFESFVTRRERQHGDRLLINHFIEWVRSMKDEVDVVLDFGTLCAQNLYEAALMAPHIHFVGTDRQALIAEMNYTAYSLPNLSFEHGDIFAVMEKVATRPGRKAFAHIRTTCTLYPKFVEELYKASSRLGYDHIYLIENAGFVRSRLKFFPFEMQEIAIATKHRLTMHNYKQQLDDAGYRIEKFSRLRAPGLWRGEHPANFLGSQYEIHASRVGGPRA